jgi:hypothetical protein
MAILRHVGRTRGLYGDGSAAAAAFVDMVLDGVSDLRGKLRAVWWARRGADGAAAVARYSDTVLAALREDEAEGKGASTGGGGGGGSGGASGSAPAARGPGLACLERLAAAAAPPSKWLYAAAGFTIADVAVFDVVDMHLAAPEFAPTIEARFPALMAHHRAVAAIPGIAAYLASDNRHPYVFGNEWRYAAANMTEAEVQALEAKEAAGR